MPRLVLLSSISKVSVLLRAPILVGIRTQIPPEPQYYTGYIGRAGADVFMKFTMSFLVQVFYKVHPDLHRRRLLFRATSSDAKETAIGP